MTAFLHAEVYGILYLSRSTSHKPTIVRIIVEDPEKRRGAYAAAFPKSSRLGRKQS